MERGKGFGWCALTVVVLLCLGPLSKGFLLTHTQAMCQHRHVNVFVSRGVWEASISWIHDTRLMRLNQPQCLPGK